jgi:diguanylate cyclase (GGDEF)-like protein
MFMVKEPRLGLAILDSLDSQIAVLDDTGRIVYVNKAWCDVAVSNGIPPDFVWTNISYLDVCTASGFEGQSESTAVGSGIKAVIAGESTAFGHEYPCHSPAELRWFQMRMVRLHGMQGLFVVSHHNITQRKLAEERVARANRELEKVAATDRLTLLANRYRLDEALESELYRAKRYGTVFAVIMIDVDHFKKVNDAFGHLIGDKVLVELAEVLRHHVRESDIAGRWGGEEFLIVLPMCEVHAARQMADKLRAEIENHAFSEQFAWGKQTCSFGVGVYEAGDTETSLIARVDAALYQAKHQGRNRVVLAEVAPAA